VRYYHEDRTHLGLQKETPGQRKTGAPRGSARLSPRRGSVDCIIATIWLLEVRSQSTVSRDRCIPPIDDAPHLYIRL
jgi:hypothetical protein